MEKMISQIKEEETCITYHSDFLWDFLQGSFQDGISHQCLIGATY